MTAEAKEISNTIQQRFAPYIDLSDGPVNIDAALRTRGLSALAVQLLADVAIVGAAEAVVDGYLDGGIDAIYADEKSGRLLLVQTKWHDNKPDKTIELGEALKFLQGVQNLLDEKYEKFNSRVQAMAGRLSSLLRRPVHLTLVIATTGSDKVGAAVQGALDDFCADLTAGDIRIDVRVLGLAAFHEFVSKGLGAPSVDLHVTLENWGKATGPHTAYYGTVRALQVLAWHKAHGDGLFDGNLRRALGETPVNQAIVSTLVEDPERFWYLNNGITIIARDVRRSAIGGASRAIGQFLASGAGVVNGAQTVTSIVAASHLGLTNIERARVAVRVVSLAKSPDWLAASITRASNTQNHIVERDFASLDQRQQQLREAFALKVGKTYVIQRGEPHPGRDQGCTVEEAAIALACAHSDVRFATWSKSNPGRLWDTSTRGAYTALFGDADLDARSIWRWVNALWAIEDEVAKEREKRTGRALRILIHGDRLIAHLVMRTLAADVASADSTWDARFNDVCTIARDVTALMVETVNENFSDNYLGSLFKNIGRCSQLEVLITKALVGDKTPDSLSDSAPSAATNIQFYLTSRRVSARGYLAPNGFVVREGSLASAVTAPSLVKHVAGYAARRQQLIDEGILTPSPAGQGQLLLTIDVLFDSPSLASSVMLGRPSNGRDEWRSIEGESLNNVLRWSS